MCIWVRTMLKIRNLESGYGQLRVLKGVSLHVNKGEIVTIIGANGAGKSTLLNTIAGLVAVRGGEIDNPCPPEVGPLPKVCQGPSDVYFTVPVSMSVPELSFS